MPTFPSIWAELKGYLNNNIVLAHNATSFDMSVLKSILNTYNLEKPNFKYYCTVSLAKSMAGARKSQLNTLASYFNINFKHHNALHDSKVCAMVAVAKQKIKQ